MTALASYEFNFAVISAELFHLLDTRMCEQLSLCVLFQVAVNSLIIGIPVCQQTLCESRSCQTLGDDKGIVAKGIEEFAQDFGLFGVLGHAVHLSL